MISGNPNRRERLVLLLALILALAALKLAFNPGLGRNSLDGDYYFQVARHVMEGDGLETSVSLYHQGLKELPAETSIYPLWPLLLGWVSHLMGLFPAAALLPEMLFVLALVLLYFVALRTCRSVGAPELLLPGGSTLDAGHLAVALFGTNHVFFQFTSLPYTEALAFTLAFAALLVLDRGIERDSTWRFAAAGLLAGGAFAARSQMVMLILAAAGAIALGGLRRRRFLARGALFLAAAVAGVVPWIIHLVGLPGPFRPRMMLSIGAYRQTPEIASFDWGLPTATAGEMWWNRLVGLGTAFDPRSAESYVSSFGLVALLVPVALLFLLTRPGLRQSPREVWRSWTEPGRILAWTVVAAGLAMVLPLHFLQSRMIWEWRFGFRHGLPFLFVLLPALFYLLRFDLLRRLTLALALLSMAGGTARTAQLLGQEFNSGLLLEEPELVTWLDAQPRPPTVITTQAHTLSVYSRAGFHWMECRESSAKVRQILALTGADYVLVYPHELGCPFAQGLTDFEAVATFGEKAERIWMLAPPRNGAADAAPQPLIPAR